MRSRVDEWLIPQGARLVHVGPPKTGTTAIQRALHRRRSELREYGVVFPGTGTRPREAGWAIVGVGIPRGRVKPTMDAWHALVDEVDAAADHRVIISNESFADGDAEAVKTIVDGMGGERVHVVHTVRRVDKLLNSHWQQRVRAGLTMPYDEWLEIVLGDPNPDNAHWHGFWRHHDLTGVLDRWIAAASPDRTTLVIADESDHELLPRMFERFLGLPQGFLPLDADRSNRSMGRNEIEMLRELHALGSEADWSDELFRHVLRFGVVDELMTMERDPYDARIELPGWAAKRAAEINDDRIDAVRSLGVRVAGDPERLRSTPSDVGSAYDETADAWVTTSLAARVTAAAIEAGERRRAREQKSAAKRRARDKAAREKIAHRAAELEQQANDVRRVDDLTTRELVAELRTRIRGRRQR